MSDRPTPQDGLIHLAPELLELILAYLTPFDLHRFGQTCHRAKAFIRPNNAILWKSAFLQVFDNPKHSWDALTPSARAGIRQLEEQWDWYTELNRRLKAYKAICTDSNVSLLTNIDDTMTALLDVARTLSLQDDDERISLNLKFLDQLFKKAPDPEKIVHDYHRDFESPSLPLEFIADADRPLTRSMMRRAAAIPKWASHFHILYGPTLREAESLRAKASARALVYDWSFIGINAEWGPLMNDNSGNVNWSLTEAIMSLMIRIFNNTRGTSFRSPIGFRSNIMLPISSASPKDWAGVTRDFVGTYGFLDYRALVHYNFANGMEYPMDLASYEEASGDLMRLKLMINETEEIRNDVRLRTKLPFCEDLPPIFFNGTSKGRGGARPAISVRGFARLVPAGASVRWRFIIRYGGADQWQLDGVQPCGVRTGGIFGLWSHVDHDDNGPTGPFAYWPAEICHTDF
ncbi:hypothetical protein BDV96DRAFT_653591 [Lophiotrema nucula]|uniref:F-box domain-containing protein n=1 Tax=Lophiotrema nucula TaxID=690887 RepID=A0A6A5YJR5_9PLEO|nr:hypothetical protein BDV96DRAFT_653591 [Lophiotrema nucula]